MRLLKGRVLHVRQLRSDVRSRAADVDRRVKAIQQKVDRLDEALSYTQAIHATTYERQRDRLREELTMAQIDRGHADALEELEMAGILAFADQVLPSASHLWVQASLNQKQRLQLLFFPEGVAFDGNRFNRTAVTAPSLQALGSGRER